MAKRRSTFTMFYYYDHMSKTTEISRQVTCKGRQERLPYRSKVKLSVNISLHLICPTGGPRTNPIEIAILLRDFYSIPAVDKNKNYRKMVQMSPDPNSFTTAVTATIANHCTSYEKLRICNCSTRRVDKLRTD